VLERLRNAVAGELAAQRTEFRQGPAHPAQLVGGEAVREIEQERFGIVEELLEQRRDRREPSVGGPEREQLVHARRQRNL